MSQFISLKDAIEMTTRYRQDRETILSTAYRDQNILCKSETFGRDVLDTLLAKSGCESIRIYYGMDTDSKVHAILVAVDDNNEDILPDINSLTAGDDIGEQGIRCPEDCPPSSPLDPA